MSYLKFEFWKVDGLLLLILYFKCVSPKKITQKEYPCS